MITILLDAGHDSGFDVAVDVEVGVTVGVWLVPLIRIAPQTFCVVTPGCDEDE